MRDPRAGLAQAGRSSRRGLATLRSSTSLRGSASSLRGAGTELAWVTAHLALYPLGVAAERRGLPAREELERFTLDDLPPVQRGLLIGDVVAAGTPIVLVHGLIDNRSIFTMLRRTLLRRGFGRVLTLNYSPLTSDVRSVAERLGRLIEQTCAETGYERVHVIGHSLGGLIARYYVQRLGGDARVHTLCTLGTPHSGTWSAKLLPHSIVRQMRPGSAVLRELAEPALRCRTRFVAFASDLDQMVVPSRAAQIDHPDLQARNVLLHGVGHMSLPINGFVVREIASLLAHLDEDGSTVTAGVTTIDLTDPAPALPEPSRRRRRWLLTGVQ